MKYIVESNKDVDRAADDLVAAVARNKFGVLNVHDLKTTLRNKGFDLPAECRIFDICNPAQAIKVLTTDLSMNLALPCRVSVYDDDGRTKIGMILPTSLLAQLSDDRTLGATAKEVEDVLKRIIDEAA